MWVGLGDGANKKMLYKTKNMLRMKNFAADEHGIAVQILGVIRQKFLEGYKFGVAVTDVLWFLRSVEIVQLGVRIYVLDNPRTFSAAKESDPNRFLKRPREDFVVGPLHDDKVNREAI